MAAQSLGELTVYQLKAVCRAKGLPVSGKKSDLVARIEAAPQGAARLGHGRGGSNAAGAAQRALRDWRGAGHFGKMLLFLILAPRRLL